ncbi:MAG: GIY-YIG nuclease family protein [Bacteroidia bacterium]|nr:GIY-YIG nuclease family protein [Bacteroidia bacterium]
MKSYFVYIITNRPGGVIYTGITNDLHRRIAEHREGKISSFSSRYNLNRLVYFEEHANVNDAILREKQIKAGSRAKKIQLIEGLNPEWEELMRNQY